MEGRNKPVVVLAQWVLVRTHLRVLEHHDRHAFLVADPVDRPQELAEVGQASLYPSRISQESTLPLAVVVTGTHMLVHHSLGTAHRVNCQTLVVVVPRGQLLEHGEQLVPVGRAREHCRILRHSPGRLEGTNALLLCELDADHAGNVECQAGLTHARLTHDHQQGRPFGHLLGYLRQPVLACRFCCCCHSSLLDLQRPTKHPLRCATASRNGVRPCAPLKLFEFPARTGSSAWPHIEESTSSDCWSPRRDRQAPRRPARHARPV